MYVKLDNCDKTCWFADLIMPDNKSAIQYINIILGNLLLSSKLPKIIFMYSIALLLLGVGWIKIHTIALYFVITPCHAWIDDYGNLFDCVYVTNVIAKLTRKMYTYNWFVVSTTLNIHDWLYETQQPIMIIILIFKAISFGFYLSYKLLFDWFPQSDATSLTTYTMHTCMWHDIH